MTFFGSLEQETSLPSFFVTHADMWAVCALHAPNLHEPHPTKFSDCAPGCPACLFCGGCRMCGSAPACRMDPCGGNQQPSLWPCCYVFTQRGIALVLTIYLARSTVEIGSADVCAAFLNWKRVPCASYSVDRNICLFMFYLVWGAGVLVHLHPSFFTGPSYATKQTVAATEMWFCGNQIPVVKKKKDRHKVTFQVLWRGPNLWNNVMLPNIGSFQPRGTPAVAKKG